MEARGVTHPTTPDKSREWSTPYVHCAEKRGGGRGEIELLAHYFINAACFLFVTLLYHSGP
jgi:hypothetical protein